MVEGASSEPPPSWTSETGFDLKSARGSAGWHNRGSTLPAHGLGGCYSVGDFSAWTGGGIGARMTGVPDYVPPVAAISVPGIDQPGYRAYPWWTTLPTR